jgi:hypothetical protein
MERFRGPPGVNVAELRAARHPICKCVPYAAWWAGAKDAPIESFEIRFWVRFPHVRCHPSCTWQLVRSCCPELFLRTSQSL